MTTVAIIVSGGRDVDGMEEDGERRKRKRKKERGGKEKQE